MLAQAVASSGNLPLSSTVQPLVGRRLADETLHEVGVLPSARLDRRGKVLRLLVLEFHQPSRRDDLVDRIDFECAADRWQVISEGAAMNEHSLVFRQGVAACVGNLFGRLNRI